jgi:energy-coupling factor transporter ATPase
MISSANQEPIFELRGVWHIYQNPQAVEALRGIDLTIYPGEYVAVIGANGSGKSTLARHLNALLLPTQGRVRTGGISTGDSQHRGEIRRRVQMVFQEPDSQIIATTVEEDVAFGPENFGLPRAEMQQRVRAALETVGMWVLRARPPSQLSAGQKQRLAIAGALAVQPQALVLDEATSMLDPAGQRAVLDVLAGLHATDTTLVTITHEMQEAALADRIVVLSQGKIAMDGTPRDIFSRTFELQRLGLAPPPLAELSLSLGLPVCLTIAELVSNLGQPPESELGSVDLPKQTYKPPRIHPEPAIHVHNLYHTYLRGTPLAVPSLKGVDLEVGRGSIMGLIGPTGSGKSTLMQHLNGLMRPQSGHVVVNGMDWADASLDARTARQQVGLLFQQAEDQLFERFVGDDIAFGPRQMNLERAEVRRRVQAAMQAVGLPFQNFKDRLSRSLSGGEQRRAALAGVLALEPNVLVVDEPTAGLDPVGRKQMLEIFRQANARGVTIVLATHRMQDIATLCDQVVALRDGQVAASGPTRQILTRSDLFEGQHLPAYLLAAIASSLRDAGWPIPHDALTLGEITAALQAAGVHPAKNQIFGST